MERSIHADSYAVLLQHLRAAREGAGLTQGELATRLGSTQSLVSKVERGARRLDAVELRAFCHALGLSFPAFIAQFDQALTEE